eukprot:GEZU01024412.1.p1 GENE.GEZU01024412.1~~GEZU01024412.1.p1  ORF type:complete len:621 (-),score=134.70 GEZU01024412.1:110-1891(-)
MANGTIMHPEKLFVQLIDEDGNFTPALSSFIEKSGLANKGIDYFVMAVFGCQSSGKSTLLNLLFGTDFPTMDATKGRHQTTKGVCVSKAKDADIIVFDMEGTDSKERGEENMTFERKTSLFALAMAEVLIVNMWMQDIGRYNASNYALLKTVFELNLQLFQRQRESKMLLHFVIRDHVETPLEQLQSQILEDIDNIWKSLQKPDEFADSKASHFFDFAFFALPHMKHVPQQFKEQVAVLRERFMDPSNPDYVFKAEYKKAVPIDGFEHYASTIWETIQANKDLDIPTQKEMLAIYRCSEISRELYSEFEGETSRWHDTVRNGQLVKGLGKQAKKLIDNILNRYTEMTSLYFQPVAESKKDELLKNMKDEVHIVYEGQLRIIRKVSLKSFETLLASVVPQSPDSVLSDFMTTVANIRTKVVEFFTEHAKDSILVCEDWEYKYVLDGLLEDIQTFADTQKKNQLERLIQHEKRVFAMELSNTIQPLMNNPPSDLWPRLREIFRKQLEAESISLQTNLEGFEATETEVQDMLKQMEAHGKDCIRSKIQEYANFLAIRMSKRFDDKFTKTEDNLPRMWKPRDNILKHFRDARASVSS